MLYLAQDSHWSPAGIELAAQYVADRVRPHLDVEKNEGSYQLESHSLRRAGDLLSMLQVPQLNRLCPPEEVGCLQVLERATGRPYRDHPESQVLVLGDSFLRIFERDEPGSAGFAAHLAYHLGRPVASIVSDGGASTLVRQDLYRRSRLLANKRVVIWEFTERDVRFGTEGWQRVPLPPAAPRE
jgi:hypothetical protein